MNAPTVKKPVFTRYQVLMIVLIALLQFTVILDFMVMAPLGALLIRILRISPSQFGWVVSVYAFSAGISGILAAGFADKFDRKKMLLVFYTGFIAGTFLCGIAPDYTSLLIARMITGLFGGVMFSINMAIVADLFALEVRGRVMGYVQTAFAASQAAGIPVGIFFATRYGWHMPFLIIVGLCLFTYIGIVRWMQPVNAHLKERAAQKPLLHLARTASRKNYMVAFLSTVFLSTGGFLMMPYSSAFLVRNVGVREEMLTVVFFVAGCAGLFTGPLIGKWSDKLGKYKVFIGGSILATIMVVVITHLSITPLWLVLVLNTLMYTAVMSRMIPTQALISGVPEMKDRGAFMSINSSIQQLGGGIASIVGGWIIGQDAAGRLVHYDTLGYVTIGAFMICIVLMYFVNELLSVRKSSPAAPPERVAVEV
ncbi:MAG TPA: MFS transporter [Puia sp.]|nr:MFS transporter [Puia sp.]